MEEQIVENYQIISTKLLANVVKEGRKNSERFCFILGAGASVSSGIPTGTDLESRWMKELKDTIELPEVRTIAANLNAYLENDFSSIESDWEKTKESRMPLPSKYYFDIYKLRFFPNHRNGYHYLENTMSNKLPGFGYYPLSLMLADGSGSNLVITTNFDSLVEDALFFYTDSKPLVINHESLANYAGDPNIKRPIIAKVHRGVLFDPLNQPEEIKELKGAWNDVLSNVFHYYTPIVIGYGGGDSSLMNLLGDKSIDFSNGIYWCYLEKHGLPCKRIQQLIIEKNGYLVRTAGFDATMLTFGNALFPDELDINKVQKRIYRNSENLISKYIKSYNELIKNEKPNHTNEYVGPENQSRIDFEKEISEVERRVYTSEKEREESKQMTWWDYYHRGEQFLGDEAYEEAIDSYTKAIDIRPEIPQFFNSRGYAYSCIDEHDKAIYDYNKAIELYPEYADAYCNLGTSYDAQKKYDEAILNYSEAIKLDQNTAIIFFNRGCTYTKMKKYEEAVLDFSKVIKLEPGCIEAYTERAKSYRLLGDVAKATQDEDTAQLLGAKI